MADDKLRGAIAENAFAIEQEDGATIRLHPCSKAWARQGGTVFALGGEVDSIAGNANIFL